MEQKDEIDIQGIKLVLTCMACPEQYNAMYQNRLVGYLRYRHGEFTVRVPDAGGDLVLDEDVGGFLDGIFTPEDRAVYLPKAVAAIRATLKK